MKPEDIEILSAASAAMQSLASSIKAAADRALKEHRITDYEILRHHYGRIESSNCHLASLLSELSH